MRRARAAVLPPARAPFEVPVFVATSRALESAVLDTGDAAVEAGGIGGLTRVARSPGRRGRTRSALPKRALAASELPAVRGRLRTAGAQAFALGDRMRSSRSGGVSNTLVFFPARRRSRSPSSASRSRSARAVA